MPTDPIERVALMNKHYLVDTALGRGALAIVRQMASWKPDAVRSIPAARRAVQADTAAFGWYGTRESVEYKWPVKNPPTDTEYEEIFRLILGEDVRFENMNQLALTMIAALRPSPQSTRVAGWLLDRGASVERPGPGRASALSRAAEQRNEALFLRMMAERKPSQEALDEALARSHWREPALIPERLLAAGARIDQEPRRFDVFFEPAQRASLAYRFYREREPLRLAIRYRADPNRQQSPTESALMNVIHDHELMTGLLELGAKPDYRDYNGLSALVKAIRTPDYVARAPGDDRPLAAIDPATDTVVRARSVAILLEHGADPNLPLGDSPTPLMLTRAEDGAIIEALLARGGRVVLPAGVEKFNRDNGTPIGPVTWSLQQRNGTLAAALVARGARAEGGDCGALFYALAGGQDDAVRALLDTRANTRFSVKHGQEGWPVLLFAAQGGSVEAVRLLLDRKVSHLGDRAPFAPKEAAKTLASLFAGGMGGGTGGGENALMAAAMAGQVEVVKELLDRGIDARQRTGLGQTAMDLARGPRAEEIRLLLRAKGL
jgi:ankyrin repeat protein